MSFQDIPSIGINIKIFGNTTFKDAFLVGMEMSKIGDQ